MSISIFIKNLTRKEVLFQGSVVREGDVFYVPAAAVHSSDLRFAKAVAASVDTWENSFQLLATVGALTLVNIGTVRSDGLLMGKFPIYRFDPNEFLSIYMDGRVDPYHEAVVSEICDTLHEKSHHRSPEQENPYSFLHPEYETQRGSTYSIYGSISKEESLRYTAPRRVLLSRFRITDREYNAYKGPPFRIDIILDGALKITSNLELLAGYSIKLDKGQHLEVRGVIPGKQNVLNIQMSGETL